MDDDRGSFDLPDETLADAVEGHVLVGVGEPLLERVEGYALMEVAAAEGPGEP